jgi:ABC-type nitrate/sulfonate/bicarbonate transport system substrate-binding protein
MHRTIWIKRAIVGIGVAALMTAQGLAVAADKLSVRLNWIPGSEHGYFYLAKE